MSNTPTKRKRPAKAPPALGPIVIVLAHLVDAIKANTEELRLARAAREDIGL